MQRQPTRGQNAWQDPSTAQPGFGAYRSSGQPSQQQPTSQPAPQPSQPNMSAYGPSFRRDETVYSPFGNFQNLGAFQQHQDAFVQQFLQGQNQYNQALNSGQQAAPVNLGQAWQQAGENIANGTYQGNPFATGNVQGLMGMFDMYGIQAPVGFQDQLISQIGQQSPPSMYSPPPAPPQPPMTSYPIGPQGEYYPGFRSPPQPAGGMPPATNGQSGSQASQPFDYSTMLVDWGQKRANGSLDVPPQPDQMAPGYGGRILNPDGAFTTDIRDRDGDGVDDRDQTAPGMPPMFQRPQSGPTGPHGEYYPGGPMTPAAPQQPLDRRSPLVDKRIEPTPVEGKKVVFGPQFGEGLTQSEYEAWKINEQVRADRLRAARAAEDARRPAAPTPESNKRLSSAYAEMFNAPEALEAGPYLGSQDPWAGGSLNKPAIREFNQWAREEKARNLAAARKDRRERSTVTRPAPRRPGRADPVPASGGGTRYVPPSQRQGPTGDPEYDNWFAKLMPRRRR